MAVTAKQKKIYLVTLGRWYLDMVDGTFITLHPLRLNI